MATQVEVKQTIWLLEMDIDVLGMMQNIPEDQGCCVVADNETREINFHLQYPDLILVDYRLIKGQAMACHNLKYRIGNIQVPTILCTTEDPPFKYLDPFVSQ